MTEIRVDGFLVGEIPTENFTSTEEAVKILGEKQTLKYIHKARNLELAHREKLKLLKEGKSGKAGAYLIKHYSKLTSDDDRKAFCKALKIAQSMMEDL